MEKGMLQQELVKKVESCFINNDWSYSYDERYCMFETGFNLQCKLKNAKLTIRCYDNGISVTTYLSIGSDEENQLQTMEFITRANYGLRVGNFQMDLDSNDIVYKAYHICTDVPEESVITQMIGTCNAMLDRYGNELLAVMFGLKNAKDAIAAVEQQ